ncbi:MAG: hypothetical protein H8E47_09555 [Anaerolineales bacterium]|nr:hypothetical protein [Anaerolineales bacterium]
MTIQILLPEGFTAQHRSLVLAYVRGKEAIPGANWPRLMEAFDLLHNAVVMIGRERHAFPAIYRRSVEDRYAARFIEQLYILFDVEKESVHLRAAVSRAITHSLPKAGYYRLGIPESRLLLAYILYWWNSWSKGYALEVYVYRDLAKAGIRFRAHDLRSPVGRFSPYDLEVLGFQGDVKTSTYFLWATRTRGLEQDFYISRLYIPRQRAGTLVTFLKSGMWEEIDGQTLVVALEQAVEVFPAVARVTHRGVELVVVDYEVWKGKVLIKQQEAAYGND